MPFTCRILYKKSCVIIVQKKSTCTGILKLKFTPDILSFINYVFIYRGSVTSIGPKQQDNRISIKNML